MVISLLHHGLPIFHLFLTFTANFPLCLPLCQLLWITKQSHLYFLQYNSDFCPLVSKLPWKILQKQRKKSEELVSTIVCNNKTSGIFPGNLPRGKCWDRERLVPLWRCDLGAQSRLWLSGQTWWVEEWIWAKHHCANIPSASARHRLAWCSSWSHFLPLGPAGNEAPSAVMPRQGFVRTGSLQLLSIVRWSSHSHPNCRSHRHTTNFPKLYYVLHLHVWCVTEMTENCWILGYFFILRQRSARKEGVIPIKWKFRVEFYLFLLEQFAFCPHSSPNLNSQNKTAHRRFVLESKSLHKHII